MANEKHKYYEGLAAVVEVTITVPCGNDLSGITRTSKKTITLGVARYAGFNLKRLVRMTMEAALAEYDTVSFDLVCQDIRDRIEEQKTADDPA